MRSMSGIPKPTKTAEEIEAEEVAAVPDTILQVIINHKGFVDANRSCFCEC